MKTIIILGDGQSGNDRNLQAMEFWNYGMKIAGWCKSLGGACEIYAPQRVCKRVKDGQPDRGADEQEALSAPGLSTRLSQGERL